ncbi:MAG: hypothetical protein E5X44_27785 [Mesorhizobium sp.]|nr:MAG: hypothetical protein E5X44_27785 [Mesorhizobium sp.]
MYGDTQNCAGNAAECLRPLRKRRIERAAVIPCFGNPVRIMSAGPPDLLTHGAEVNDHRHCRLGKRDATA